MARLRRSRRMARALHGSGQARPVPPDRSGSAHLPGDAMAARIEFFFDCSSPWTYLAFHAIQPLAAEELAEIIWKPILVGGVFNAVNDTVYKSRENPNPRKLAYQRKDLDDWARLYGLKIMMPPSIFPVNSVKCMRGCLVALDEGRLPRFARAGFEMYWSEDRDLASDAVVSEIARRAGLDPQLLLRRIAEPAVKERLKANTDELIARGGFGSPTIFVDGDDMFFGNDRLPLVRAALHHGR
jgi:2-hydroxychromene-2-carboxylate isomerase